MGLGYLVFTSIKSQKLCAETYIDEFTAQCMFLFRISCTLSSLSIRSVARNSLKYEIIAYYIFLFG